MVKENAKFFKVVMPEQKQGEAVMSKGQSEREYLDETYNRLSNCARGAGARARFDSEIQDLQKEADDAWKEYSKAAKWAEETFSKFEGVLRRKGLLP